MYWPSSLGATYSISSYLQDIDHEVAAAGRLIDWVAARRHGLGRDLPRAGNGGLQLRRRRGRQRVGDRRRDRGGCADQDQHPSRNCGGQHQVTSRASAWRPPADGGNEAATCFPDSSG